jgi:hypothetical protein
VARLRRRLNARQQRPLTGHLCGRAGPAARDPIAVQRMAQVKIGGVSQSANFTRDGAAAAPARLTLLAGSAFMELQPQIEVLSSTEFARG